jgi:hypothetical protein
VGVKSTPGCPLTEPEKIVKQKRIQAETNTSRFKAQKLTIRLKLTGYVSKRLASTESTKKTIIRGYPIYWI